MTARRPRRAIDALPTGERVRGSPSAARADGADGAVPPIQRDMRFLAGLEPLLAGALLDYDATLAAVARYVVPEIADYASIDVLTADGAVRRVTSAHRDPAKEPILVDLWRRFPYRPDGDAGSPLVLRTGAPQIALEIDPAATAAFARGPEHLALLQALNPQSYMAVPLAFAGRTLGVLSLVMSDSGRRYDDHVLELAMELARRAAAAIEGARLYRDVERARATAAAEAERDAFLAAASDVLASSLDYHVTLAAVADLAVPQLADWCTIRVVEAGSTREIATSPERREPDCTSTLVVPMAARGRIVGSITLAAMDPVCRFSDADRSLAKELARRAAIAIDHAWLFDAAEHARREAEGARQLAEAASRAKSQFLAVMSHELRTPLNAIAGHVQLLEMEIHGPVTDAQRDALLRIDRSQRHLLRLINNVLNLERIESGRIAYEIEDVAVCAVAAELGPMIEPQLAAKNLGYAVRLPPDDVRVRADPALVGQILLNLLSNAVKFTPPGGRIALDTTMSPNMPGAVFLRVTDTGIGIPRDKQTEVFEPFVQVHTGPTRTSEGAGLGLAISRDLARAMGGDLRVRSVEGGGSTFTLRLPRAESARRSPDDDGPPARGADASSDAATVERGA